MMERILSRCHRLKLICLLISAGIFCIMTPIYAEAADRHIPSYTSSVVSNLENGETDERTNIEEPGSAESAEDLQELNIANTVTVTYENGNGDRKSVV